MKGVLSAILVVLSVFLPGCSGKNSDSCPRSTENIAGVWSGRGVDELAGEGSILLSMNQDGTCVAGVWSTTADNGGDNGGTLAGAADNQTLTLELQPSNEQLCPSNVTAIITGNSITGNYISFNCTVIYGGSFTITRDTDPYPTVGEIPPPANAGAKKGP